MKIDNKFNTYPDFRFNLEEIAGAIGDYGTLFPIVLGVAFVSNLNLGHILLFFSAWYIITGLYYKMPMPVEPMKVIGAIVIAGGLSQQEITASGMILGALFLILGFCKGMKFIQDKVPSSVVRGIQMGLALILFRTSISFIIKDSVLSIICITIILLFFIANKFIHLTDVSAIVVLLIGYSDRFTKIWYSSDKNFAITNFDCSRNSRFFKRGMVISNFSGTANYN